MSRPERAHYRVAIVGSGPAGLYTTAALLAGRDDVSVDVFEKLPTPYGLVRYGVAPDHAKIKAVTKMLARPFDRPNVRFLGNVEVGVDIRPAELSRYYHAVVFAYGAERDRPLNIEGSGLRGVKGALELVRWYNGHPDAPDFRNLPEISDIAIVGGGNVALDLARMLAKTGRELTDTDVPQHVLATLSNTALTNIHVLVRRGPREAKFTPSELIQLQELEGAGVRIYCAPSDLTDRPGDDRRVRQNLAALRGLTERDHRLTRRTIHFRFNTRPVSVLGECHITGLCVETTSTANTGPRSVRTDLPVQMLVSAIGFHGVEVEGLPFDTTSGCVPNEAGRVRAGTYVAGWIKRGPTGVIGTNKPDGAETAQTIIADLAVLPDPTVTGDLADVLRGRGVQVVSWDHWRRIEVAEARYGTFLERSAVKFYSRTQLLAAHPGHAPTPEGPPRP